jgi:outer membrane protein assembly factor BamB
VQPTASDSSATEWRFDTDGPVFSSPTVAAGTVYVGSHDDTVYAVPVSPV